MFQWILIVTSRGKHTPPDSVRTSHIIFHLSRFFHLSFLVKTCLTRPSARGHTHIPIYIYVYIIFDLINVHVPTFYIHCLALYIPRAVTETYSLLVLDFRKKKRFYLRLLTCLRAHPFRPTRQLCMHKHNIATRRVLKFNQGCGSSYSFRTFIIILVFYIIETSKTDINTYFDNIVLRRGCNVPDRRNFDPTSWRISVRNKSIPRLWMPSNNTSIARTKRNGGLRFKPQLVEMLIVFLYS